MARQNHNLSNTRQYTIFRKMKQRCYNVKCEDYHYYGGRGIKICEEWLKDFTLFYNWSIKNGYSEYLSIDRIDNNGNYCPENCRWADVLIQRNNRRNNSFITIFGETKTVGQWGRDSRCLVNSSRFKSRIASGMDPEKALNTPGLKEIAPKYQTLNGETKRLFEWAKDERCKVSYTALQGRLNMGWDFEQALVKPARPSPKNKQIGRPKKNAS